MKTKLATFLTTLAISLLGLGGGLAHAAGSGSLALSPSSGTENVGTTFSVDVYENGNGTSVNVVTADLSYNAAQLQYVSANCGGVFNNSASISGGSGSVSLSCFVAGGATAPTDNELIGSVSFEALAGSGSTSINFGSDSIMATPSTSPSTNIWNGATTGGSFTLTTPTITPPTTGGSSSTGSGTTTTGSSSSTAKGASTTGTSTSTGSTNSTGGTSSTSTPTPTTSTSSTSSNKSNNNKHTTQKGKTIHGRLVSSTGMSATAYWILGIVLLAVIAVILVFRQKLLGTLKTVTSKYSLNRGK